MDFLKSAVASAIAKGPLAGYILADRVDLEESIWTLNNATKRDDGTKCSIFTFETSNRKHLPLARNALRKFRTLRHPGVLRVLDTVETDTQLCLITERLTPLAWHVRRKSLSEEAIKWGLWNVAKTLAFVNNEAASVHACVRLSSIFTGESGEWKLGGFEVLSAIADEEGMVHAHTGLLRNYNPLLPPEAARSGWGCYKQDTWAAVDAWEFAYLISELFGSPSSGPAQPSELRGLPPSMQQQYKRLLNPNPKGRLTVAGFLEQGRRSGGYFNTQLITITESLDSLGLKSDGEREEFLDELNEVAQQFPDEFLIHRILPEMLKSVEFGGGGPKVFSVVLQIASKLLDDDYEKQVLPVIVRLFASPDRALRVCLLSALPSMIERLPKNTVNDKIFPNIVTGFSDVAPLVREQTVKSVLVIITKLSDRVINGELLKHLAKTANDAEPGIRTNTTICLGKMAKYLGPSTRTKVLVAAFTRSLKDPFVHARSAAILALGATVDSFSDDDCATKLLPAICPSLLDKEKIVRDQAAKVADQYMSRIRKFAQDMPETALPPASANPTSAMNGGPRIGTPASDNSWTGWAISSFTNKTSAADGTIQPNPRAVMNGVSGPGSAKPTPPTSRSSTPSAAKRSMPVRQAPTRQITETTRLAQSFVEPALALNDGWGDMEDTTVDDAWGTMDDDAEDGWSAGAADPSSTTTTSNRSSIATSTTATRTSRATSYNDGGEPDFAGWLKAQQSSKAKKGPLPKGLASNTNKPAPAPSASTIRPISKPASKPPAQTSASKEDDDWGDAWT